MADVSIPTHDLGPDLMRRALGQSAWANLKAYLRRGTPDLVAPSILAEDPPQTDPAPTFSSADEQAVHAHVHAESLLNAYAASVPKMSRQVDTLDPSAAALNLGPVAVRALVEEVLQGLEPLACEAGFTLLRDADSRCDGVCCADPGELRRVLFHLVLRALSMEQAPGHVRVIITFTGYEARVLILTRTPETGPVAHTGGVRSDLIAPQRLLQAMGGALVLEPRRAGYLPLCIVLPALHAG